MRTLHFKVWTALAIALGITAGLQTNDDLAEAFAVMSTFATGGAVAVLITLVRPKLERVTSTLRLEDRVDELETRLASVQDALAAAEFDRRLSERPAVDQFNEGQMPSDDPSHVSSPPG